MKTGLVDLIFESDIIKSHSALLEAKFLQNSLNVSDKIMHSQSILTLIAPLFLFEL